MIGYIYKTTNLINNKIYVGQKKSNVFLHEEYLGSGSVLKQAIKKYGKANFKVEMLDTAESLEELGEKERYWIIYLNAEDVNIGYNRTKGGLHVPNSGFKGKHHTEENKRKQSERRKKAPPASLETRLKISKANTGSKRTAATKELMSKQQQGRKAYTDGTIKRYFKPGDVIPEGFYPGIPEWLKSKYRVKGRYHHSEEERVRISKRNSDRWSSYTAEEYREVCKNMSNADKGRSSHNKGKKREYTSQEARKKISEANKGRLWIHKETVTKMIHPYELADYEALGYVKGRK